MASKSDQTVKVAVITGVFAIGAAATKAWLTQSKSQNPPASHSIHPSSSTQLSAAIDSEDRLREDIRSKHGVMKMSIAQNEMPFFRLPHSSWGYTWLVHDQPPDEITMFVAPNDSKYEIHKLPSGAAFIVGFVGPDAAAKLASPKPPEKYEFTIYSKRWADAPEIVTLPLSSVEETGTSRFIPLKECQISAWDIRIKDTASN